MKDWFFDNYLPENMKTDIEDKEDKVLIEIELPGYKKKDIDIKYHNDILTVSAKREKKEGRLLMKERICETQARAYRINGLDKDKITAVYEDGLLKIDAVKITPAENSISIEVH